jgi:hypothetical protein
MENKVIATALHIVANIVCVSDCLVSDVHC